MDWFGDFGGGRWIFCLLVCLFVILGVMGTICSSDCVGTFYTAQADLGFPEICLPLPTLTL